LLHPSEAAIMKTIPADQAIRLSGRCVRLPVTMIDLINIISRLRAVFCCLCSAMFGASGCSAAQEIKMNHSDIELMAQGFPPLSIGKDHEEVVIWLATQLLDVQQKLGVAIKHGDTCMQAEIVWEKAMMAAIGEDGVGSVSKAIATLKAERDAVLAENARILNLLTDVSENYGEAQSESEEAVAVIDLDNISHINDYVSRDVNAENPFFNTNAILNSVRAEGAASVGTIIRACAHEFPDSVEDIVEECAIIADNKAVSLRAVKDR
jgi:hypothetical protein